jgi:xylulokinase
LQGRDILALDVGTTAFKMGVFSPELEKRCESSRRYDVHVYDRGKADIEPEKWWRALKECCKEVQPYFSSVGVVSFSVTTPGLTPMAADGTALDRAISGGSSLCSILWIRDNHPEIWESAAMFGHTNTYMVKRFTGNWVIDPSTVSITGLYNSWRHDLTWNRDVLRLARLPEQKLPPLMNSYDDAGTILPAVANELGLPPDCVVLCGGNDAVLAALSGGFTEPGDINIICGTCDITNVCVDTPVASPNFNVRCHVIPGRWVTFFVLNTGGKALEWFYSVFCRDMSEDRFYEEYAPRVLLDFLNSPDLERREAELPVYVPFLGGCRYTLEQMTAAFSNVTLETTREHMLVALVKGNAEYHGQHLSEVGRMIKLGRRVMTSGGGAKLKGSLEARRRWTGDFEYGYQDQSSLVGAAMLGQFYLTGRYRRAAQGPAQAAAVVK